MVGSVEAVCRGAWVVGDELRNEGTIDELPRSASSNQ